jgi:hypothetical protein
MRVINVIESVDNEILGMESFGIFEEQLSGEVVAKAEEHFAHLISKDLGCNASDIEDLDTYIEDGVYVANDLSITIVWSDI